MDHKTISADRHPVIGAVVGKEGLFQQFTVFGERVNTETALQLSETAVPPQKRQRLFRRYPYNQGVAVLRCAGAQRDGTAEGVVADHPFGRPRGIAEGDIRAFMQRLAAVRQLGSQLKGTHHTVLLGKAEQRFITGKNIGVVVVTVQGTIGKIRPVMHGHPMPFRLIACLCHMASPFAVSR